ncbi:MAG: carbohydrate binding domain-containing protein, partial [Saprospiraceae bacterium]|nr:carbohydrate binding domain-containing protein [Saprospiraceae bacterium]
MNKQLPSSLSRFAGIVLLVLCYANLVAQTCTGNLLTNPGFENNLNNWNPQGNVTAITSAHSGTKAARLGGTGYASIGQAFPTTAGTSYTASFWARNVGTVEMRFLNASWQQILGTGTSAGPTSAAYQELTMTKIAPVGAVYIYLIAWKDGSQTMDVDDFCLIAGSTANYPDLVPSNLTVPATITHGTAFTYSFIAKNNGTAASAATSFSVEILGYEVARLPLQALQPGQQVTISKTMTLPQNFLYGSGSSMSVKLDLADDLVQELQENNNELFTPLQINQGTGGLNLSDLTPSNLVALPANGAPQNTSASVNFTISNLGTAPIFANPLNPATQNHVNSVYLSTNNLLDASDILLENSAVPFVTPIGSINNLSIVFTVPNGTPAGSYFLIVKLDGDQQVPEQNENNNTASIPFTVTAGTGPCTVVATLEAVECYDNQSPNDPTDDQYCVTLNATYTGTGCSPYFTYNQENFTYGSSITVCGFPANGVSPVLLLHDSANPAAQTTVTAPPPAGCLNTALPDLTLTDLQIPASVVAGSSFTANIIVRNIGTAASVPTGLLFYLGSQNPATITVPAIPAGGQLSYSPSISTSPNYTGPASLQGKIDQLGNVNIESNENNNEIGAAFNITSGGGGGTGQIDLSLALQQLTASPAQWSNYPVKLTISNAGPQAATGVKVKFAKPTGVVYVGGNEFTASQGTFNPNGDEVWTVGSIPANGSATLTVNYFLLNATAPVAYAQVTAANETDSDSQPNNGTPPTPVQDDEASTSGGTPPPPAADFVATPSSIISFGISQVSGSTPSRRFGFNFVGQNTGTAVPVGPGATPVTVGFYLSSDNALSASDYAIGTFTLSSSNGLTFGNQADLQPIADNVPGGTYYLIAKMDDGNLFAEPNETNNVAVYGQQVVLPTLNNGFTCPGNLLQNGDFDSGVL